MSGIRDAVLVFLKYLHLLPTDLAKNYVVGLLQGWALAWALAWAQANAGAWLNSLFECLFDRRNQPSLVTDCLPFSREHGQ